LNLIQTMRADGVKLLLVEDFYNRNTAQLVASKASAKLLTLPTDVGATPDIKTWFDLVNAILKQLAIASA
jgi:ABC-type Zn uptake system ZnuABC Zn-binding protein ZnuA